MLKSLAVMLCSALATAGALFAWVATHPDVPPIVSGQYVEVRDASVFAGACHVNSEAESQGRQALLGWHVDGGRFLELDLAGVEVAAAVTSDGNLSDGLPRRSVVYLDRDLDAELRKETLFWLREVHGEALGTIEAVVDADVDVFRDGPRFGIDVEGVAHVRGATMPDGECCTMPESVWYEPLAETETKAVMVGLAEDCRFRGDRGLPAWSYEDRNNAFAGAFTTGGPGCAAPCERVTLDAPTG